MNAHRDPLRSGLASILAVSLLTGLAFGTHDRDAASQLAEARVAYEKALADLRAAEAALAEATLKESGSADTGQPSDVSAPSPGENTVPPEAIAPEPGFFDWRAWEKSIDIGITGASGNSDNLNARLAFGAERRTDKVETKLAALYRLSKQESDTTENRFRLDVFNDWLPPEGSRIRWWAQGAYEYDEFQEWDHRLSAAAGIGYELIKNDKHTLVGRLGLGASQTFGDVEEFRPEAIAALDYAYQIKENQRFTAGTEFRVDVSEIENWRNNSFAQYEALIDAESNLTFKTGVTNRYDSNPGDAEKNDLEYFASLGWKF